MFTYLYGWQHGSDKRRIVFIMAGLYQMVHIEQFLLICNQEFGRDHLESVSYTHLDVYKRQPPELPLPVPPDVPPELLPPDVPPELLPPVLLPPLEPLSFFGMVLPSASLVSQPLQ